MVIGWKKQDLIDLKNKYNALLKKTDDATEELKIIDTLGSINTVLDSMNPISKRFFGNSKESHKTVIETDLLFLRYYGLFAPYLRMFAQDNRYLDDRNTDLERLNDSSFKLFTTITDFYKGTNAFFANKYMSLIEGDSLRLRMLSAKNKEAGCTFPILGTKIVYMTMSRVNSLQDYLTLAHEMGHGVAYYINPEDMMDDDRMMYSEAISIFFETIANDYVAARDDKQKDGLSIKIETFNDYLHTARMVCAMMDALSMLTSRELNNRKKITRFLEEYSCCDKDDIEFLLTNPFSEMFKYVSSYLVAVELYLIYLNDKDNALNLLRKMTTVEVSDPRKYLEYLISIGIHPGRNIEEYASMLAQEKKNYSTANKLSLHK